ncbi:hypothetical protein ACRAWF_18470 [Streptomyces sp. L7]
MEPTPPREPARRAEDPHPSPTARSGRHGVHREALPRSADGGHRPGRGVTRVTVYAHFPARPRSWTRWWSACTA